jgi:hypothetical protein
MSKLLQNQSPVAKKNFTFPIGAILKPKSIENRSRAAECGLENNNRLKFSKIPPVGGQRVSPPTKMPRSSIADFSGNGITCLLHWIAIAN